MVFTNMDRTNLSRLRFGNKFKMSCKLLRIWWGCDGGDDGGVVVMVVVVVGLWWW